MASESEKVIVGLGNPGKKYALTRHNIGATIVLALADKLGWPLKPVKRTYASAAKGVVGETTIHLVVPDLYMNESGQAVRSYLDYYGFRASHLAVVVDDVDLPFGMMRLRETGSAGGHNGLKSIQAHIGTQNYVRLRVGVGEKKGEQELADHVLGKFSAAERGQLDALLERGGELLLRIAREKIVDVMNDVNTKVKQKPEEKDLVQSTQESDHDNSRQS